MGHLHSIVEPKVKCRRQESNLIFELRGLACESGTLRRHCFSFSTPPRNRTSSGRFEVCHAVHHTRRAFQRFSIPTWDRTRTFGGSHAIRYTTGTCSSFSVPTWIRTRTKTLGRSCAVRYTIGTSFPSRADDWIRTSINRPKKATQSKPAPFSVEPRRQARARGVEPRPPVLEAGCSPRSTLVLLVVKSSRPLEPGAIVVNYFASSTFQYASLMNFDQLSIRSSCAA